MTVTISYSEISTFLNKHIKVTISLSYISSDKIRISFTPHKLIGPIHADLKFYLDPYGELSIAADSDSPGVGSVISGLTTMMATKQSYFPYLQFSGQLIKVNLKKVPQLTNILKTVSLSSCDANSSGLYLTITI